MYPSAPPPLSMNFAIHASLGGYHSVHDYSLSKSIAQFSNLHNSTFLTILTSFSPNCISFLLTCKSMNLLLPCSFFNQISNITLIAHHLLPIITQGLPIACLSYAYCMPIINLSRLFPPNFPVILHNRHKKEMAQLSHSQPPRHSMFYALCTIFFLYNPLRCHSMSTGFQYLCSFHGILYLTRILPLYSYSHQIKLSQVYALSPYPPHTINKCKKDLQIYIQFTNPQ